MAHTEVFISNDADTLVPSQPTVEVNVGDTLAFSVSGSGPVFAFLSPAAISALSPSPASPVALSIAGPTVFTFTTSDAGAYSVFFETTPDGPVPDFPLAKSAFLQLEIDTDGAGFGGITNHSKGG